MIWQGEDLSPLKLGQLQFLGDSLQWFIKCQGGTAGKHYLSPLPWEKMILQGLWGPGGMITKEMPRSESDTFPSMISSIAEVPCSETRSYLMSSALPKSAA